MTLASSLSIFYEIISYFPSDPLYLCVLSLFNCSLSCYLSCFHYSKPIHWSHGLWFLRANLSNKNQGKEDTEYPLNPLSPGCLLCSTTEPHYVGYLLKLIWLCFLLLFMSLDILGLLCSVFSVPAPACSDSDSVFLLVTCPPSFLSILFFWCSSLIGTTLWTCATFGWFPAHNDGPFLSLEEVTLKKQWTLLHPSSTQSCLPWDSSEQDIKHIKVYSPEI